MHGHLTFGGTLRLAAWNGFVAQEGQTFDLFDWSSTSGQFTEIRRGGLGLAPGLALDTARLYIDGTVTVSAVPEPATYALMLGGLAFVATVARRRRPAAAR